MTPLQRARLSLEGLSIGDAFGQNFFLKTDLALHLIESRAVPAGPWYLTDDSIMAIAIVDVLSEFGTINQDALAARFAESYQKNPARGYGASAHTVLQAISKGEPWQTVSANLFDGLGSFGNGAAMRVAPLGAYFAEDINEVIRQSKFSAEVTHAHPDGIAGAISIACAAAWVIRSRDAAFDSESFFAFLLDCTPDSETRSGIERASQFPLAADVERASQYLGNGTGISSSDTVPFVVWSIARGFANFETALWDTVKALGDRDTTCAMVGGVLALRHGLQNIPAEWQELRESIDDWESSSEVWI